MNKNIEFLNIKEQRFNKVKALVSKSECVVIIKVNYPGNQKLNAFTFFVFTQIVRDLGFELDEITYSIEGPIGYHVSNQDSMRLKEKLVAFEQSHSLGRLIDCDVLTYSGMISRSELGKEMRTCLICDQAAHNCIVSQKHTIKEIKQAFHNRVIEYCNKDLERQILFAMLSEVSTHPGFGLVNPINSGIHQDMDIALFIKSAYAIAPHFKKVSQCSTDSPQHFFNDLRNLGIEIEKTMFEATENVNTHKGLIFL